MPLYEADFLGEPTPIKPKSKGKQKQKSNESELELSTPLPLAKEKVSRKRKSPEVNDNVETTQSINKTQPKKKPEIKKKPESRKKQGSVETPKTKDKTVQNKKSEDEETGLDNTELKKRKPKLPKDSPSSTSNSDESEYETMPSVPKKIKIRKKKTVSPTVPEKASNVAPKVQIIASQQESNETQPPQWFRAYVLDEQKRRNQEKLKKERQPQTVVKEIADEVAKQEWENPTKRGMINNEVDRHMSRMYQMIHGRRL